MHDPYVNQETGEPIPRPLPAKASWAPAIFFDCVHVQLITYQSYAKLTAAERRLAARVYQEAGYDEARFAAIQILGRRRTAALARWKARDPESVKLYESFGKGVAA